MKNTHQKKTSAYNFLKENEDQGLYKKMTSSNDLLESNELKKIREIDFKQKESDVRNDKLVEAQIEVQDAID